MRRRATWRWLRGLAAICSSSGVTRARPSTGTGPSSFTQPCGDEPNLQPLDGFENASPVSTAKWYAGSLRKESHMARPETATGVRLMNVVVVPDTPVDAAYEQHRARSQELAPDFTPDQGLDLQFHGGKTIPSLTYTNFY